MNHNCCHNIMLLIYLCMFISIGLAAKLPGPPNYDLVWLASVQQHGPIGGVDDNRNTLHTLPSFHDTDVQYKLFTRENPYDFQELKINDTDALKASNFHFEKKVKVLVHGWINSGSSPMPESVKEAYLNVSDLNIIVVDWGEAANVNYISASYNVAKVGHHLTQFLEFLVGQGVSTDDMHLIGHSLGAHVAGIAGAYVENATIDTITGLDPALPLFLGASASQRLDRHDARHVEVIHSCGGYLGFHWPLGHVDFYPNGGIRQPGCGTDFRGFCAHNRAHMFFSESIISEVPFTSVRCRDYGELFWSGYCEGTGEKLIMGGFDIHYGREGIYYLQTRAESPYAQGEGWIDEANNESG